MRPPGTPYQLQKRREYAIRLLQSGESLSAVARAVSAAPSSVLRWQRTYQRHGWRGLQAQSIPGRPPRLSPVQKKKLEQVLLAGPLAAGFKTDFWTLKRIAQMIKRLFGVAYHPSHVWKILNDLDWSCQKPERRATQRDEKAIAHWKWYRWPKIKKKADALGAYLVFLFSSWLLTVSIPCRSYSGVRSCKKAGNKVKRTGCLCRVQTKCNRQPKNFSSLAAQ